MERTQTPGRDRVRRDRGRARALDFRTRERAPRRRARGDALVDLGREQPDDADGRRLQRAFRGRAGGRGPDDPGPDGRGRCRGACERGHHARRSPTATDSRRCGSGLFGRGRTLSFGARLSRRSGRRTASPSRTSRPRTASTRQASWSREPVFRFRRLRRASCPPGWAAIPSPSGDRAARTGGGRLLERDAKTTRSRTTASTSTRRDPVSAYRTTEQQQELYDLYLSGQGAPANPPGTSSHESGTAVDVAEPSCAT